MKVMRVHTCYGCEHYYRVNMRTGEKEYYQPFSNRHCDIENPWYCSYFTEGKSPDEVKHE